jgi:chemotaxis protein methyltransferase CheR
MTLDATARPGRPADRERKGVPTTAQPPAASFGESRLGPPREFEFTQADFERVRKLIHEHAGISLAPAKYDMVYSRLARRLRANGDRSFSQYLARLERGDAAEWETFVNSLTTNLTSFFREAHHFEILARQIDKWRDRRPLRIWCSAASTGEEPYSIAMTLAEVFNSMAPPVTILASDLDTSVLAHGRRGVYTADRVEKLSPERIQRFFLRGTGGEVGQVRVRPELQRLISWQRINLLDATWPLQGPLDALFCRNVMIYFDKPTQYRILRKMAPLLHRDGLFFAGHSESFMHATDLLRPLGRTVYVRADECRMGK